MVTYTMYHMNGNREDLANLLVNISPEETPMLSGFKKTKASGKLHEWMQDELTPGANGRVVEGSDATAGTLQARTRVGNYCQINRKAFQVSDSQNSSSLNKAGIGNSEYEYQLSKALKEIALDIEVDIVSGVSAAGDSATARASRGVLDFISTNVETGAAGGASTRAAAPRRRRRSRRRSRRTPCTRSAFRSSPSRRSWAASSAQDSRISTT